MLPKISSYGQYDNSNYGAHTLKVDLGDIEFTPMRLLLPTLTIKMA